MAPHPQALFHGVSEASAIAAHALKLAAGTFSAFWSHAPVPDADTVFCEGILSHVSRSFAVL